MNKFWSKERLLKAGIITEAEAKCDRCGANLGTDFHRYSQCPGNNLIEDECIGKSNWMAQKAKDHHRHKAKWYRAILPGDLMGKPVGWQDEAVCDPTVIGDFPSILESTGKAGTDGA